MQLRVQYSREHNELFSDNIPAYADWIEKKLSKVNELPKLKDKNGTEFGEGDVLQYTEHPGYILQTGKMLVCWDKDHGCWGYKYEHSIFKHFIFPFAQHDELRKDVLNHCELIGNINDSKELFPL